MEKETKGIILALLAAIVSGISIPLNKLFIVNLDPSVFTAVRALIIGSVFLMIALYVSKTNRKPFKKVSWKYLIAIAIIGGSFAFLLYFTGLQLTTASRAAFLQKTLPLYTAIFAYIFLKEKISRKMSYALAAMLIGTVIIYFTQVTPGAFWQNPSLGDLLIIAATILWAIEAVIAKKAMSLGESNVVVTFARMFFGGIILFGVVLLFGKFGLLLTLSAHQWVNITISTILLFAYVLFWYWSIKYINVTKATTLLLVASVIAVVFATVLFPGEPLPPLQIVGSAIILIGAYFVGREKSEKRK
ncbi:MAG: DMT family transporter [Candidatus Micrarchaeaceae archaeon]|jgi:drug/metabolite transporter (DMT)-like permease